MEDKEISQELPIMQEMKMLIEEYEQLLQEALEALEKTEQE